MSSEAEFVLELWESVRDFVPNSKREEVATGILQRIGASINFLPEKMEYRSRDEMF